MFYGAWALFRETLSVIRSNIIWKDLPSVIKTIPFELLASFHMLFATFLQLCPSMRILPLKQTQRQNTRVNIHQGIWHRPLEAAMIEYCCWALWWWALLWFQVMLLQALIGNRSKNQPSSRWQSKHMVADIERHRSRCFFAEWIWLRGYHRHLTKKSWSMINFLDKKK